jgi:hypothetical protein
LERDTLGLRGIQDIIQKVAEIQKMTENQNGKEVPPAKIPVADKS